MSYAIAHMIYGYPLVSNDTDTPSPRASNLLIDEALEDECDGFLEYYSGGSDEEPAAFGVELSEFDEACAFVTLDNIPVAPTTEQAQQFRQALEALEPELKAAVCALGEPSVFLLWSIS